MDYSLTPLGQTLLGPVTVLATWAQTHNPEVERAREAFDQAAQPSPAAPCGSS